MRLSPAIAMCSWLSAMAKPTGWSSETCRGCAAGPSTGAPGARCTQGVDDAGQQVDARGMVAGIGHVQRIALQHQRLRAMECRFGKVAIHEIGGTRPNWRDAPPWLHSRMRWWPLSAMYRRSVLALAAPTGSAGPGAVPMQFAAPRDGAEGAPWHSAFKARSSSPGPPADQPLLLLPVHPAAPGSARRDAEAAPAIPVGIQQHRHGQALATQQFQCSAGVTFEIEARHLQHQRLQLARMARQPLAELGQALRAQADEQQRDRPAAQFGQGAGGWR